MKDEPIVMERPNHDTVILTCPNCWKTFTVAVMDYNHGEDCTYFPDNVPPRIAEAIHKAGLKGDMVCHKCESTMDVNVALTLHLRK